MIEGLLLLPLAGAALAPALGVKSVRGREAFLRLLLFAQFALALALACCVWQGGEYALTLPGWCGLGLCFRADFFRAMYACLAGFMWACAAQLSPQYFAHHAAGGGRYACFTLLTLCGVTGVFFSDDLYTAFVFFEIMSIASYPWVAHEETGEAMRAARLYLAVSVICGMVTLMGMFLCWRAAGTLSFAAWRQRAGDRTLMLPAALMLVGFGAKAGLFPLHIWLPKAHPVAPAPASALLSGMLTKTGLFGVIAIGMNLMGEEKLFGDVLLALGLITMTLGAVLGVFSVNLKRTLACSSLSQIGYITVGLACAVLLGHHGALPAAGAVGHMVNHSLLKLCLFLCAGAVYMNAHTLDLNALRGFGRGKPLLHAVFLLGTLGLCGVPLLNGYASKTMIHEGLAELAAEEAGFSVYRLCEWAFLFAAGLTTAYMLKLYLCLFWQKNPDAARQADYDQMKRRYLTGRSAAVLIVTALPLPVLGALPNETLLALTGRCAPFLQRDAVAHLDFFSSSNLLGGGVSLLIGAVVYFLFVRTCLYKKGAGYLDRWPRGLDLEARVYHPVFGVLLPRIGGWAASLLDGLPEGTLVRRYLGGALSALARGCDRVTEGRLVRRWIPGAWKGLFCALDQLLDQCMARAKRLLPDEGLEEAEAPAEDAFAAAGRKLARGGRASGAAAALLLAGAALLTAGLIYAAVRWGVQ